ncbi:MAG: DUF1294 domain-containing protein [Clostridia bacterium]|nr:DUF1294 domain-containing protein [Clostridia bacterium]
MYDRILFFVYLGVLLLSSLAAFCLFGRDKALAGKEGAVRIREKTLLFFTVFGGAAGAFFGRRAFRHKTNKRFFSVTVVFALLLQTGTLLFLLWKAGGFCR